MEYQPIILIGAARSGTKILRDTISTHPEINKIKYDINFIWKKYSEHINHDELSVEDISPKFKKFIKYYFKKNSKGKPFIIEKTVSNTLRIPFLLELFPNAKFIILYRDGRDVVESVRRQWNVVPPVSYQLKKMLSIPVFQVIPYLFKYALNIIKLKLNPNRSTKSHVWGVKYKGYENDMNDDLLTFCSKQWIHCANAIIENQNKIPLANKLIIRYEDLVMDPKNQFQEIAEFLDLNFQQFDYLSIKPANIGKAVKSLDDKEYNSMNLILKDTLKRLGYNE